MFYRFMRQLGKIFVYVLIRPRVRGRENAAIKGNTIILCNHLKLRDPIILAALFKPQIYFIAKEELFRSRILGWFLRKAGTFPVKRGGSDIEAVRTCLDILKSDGVLGVFPEGTRSRTGELGEFEPGAAMFALKTGATVVPVVIHNRYSFFKRPYITIGAPLDMGRFTGIKRTAQVIADATNHFESSFLKLKSLPWEGKQHARARC